MFDFFYREDFLNAFHQGRHFYFKHLHLPLLKWEDIIQAFNDNFKNNGIIKNLKNYGLVFHDCSTIPITLELLKAFSSLDSGSTGSAHAYVSLTEQSSSFDRHCDSANVFYWQVIGSSKWIVEDKITVEYNLSPNSAIYIPKAMFHEVIPLEPRVGISFGLEK